MVLQISPSVSSLATRRAVAIIPQAVSVFRRNGRTYCKGEDTRIGGMINLFHTHKWEEVGKDYTPAGKNIFRTPLSYEDRTPPGTTHIYLKCVKCGDIKQRNVVGKYD